MFPNRDRYLREKRYKERIKELEQMKRNNEAKIDCCESNISDYLDEIEDLTLKLAEGV